MPVATPVTIPVDEPAVAMPVLLLLHVPPPVLVNVVASPTQTLNVPEMEDGSAFTVTILVAAVPHPVA